MVFQANEAKVSRLMVYATNTLYAGILFLICFNTLALLVVYHKTENKIYAAVYGLLIVIMVCVPTFALVKGVIKNTNLLVTEIELNENEVRFQTSSAVFFGGIVNKPSLEIHARKEQVRFRRASSFYFTQNKDIIDVVYLLTVDGTEYLVANNFYDDFQQIFAYFEYTQG